MAQVDYQGNYNKKEDFEEIASSPEFQALLTAKRKFLVPSIIIFFGLYLLFPILISYTNWMEAPAIGDISWAWIYSLFLFIMTWTMATLYMRKSAELDRLAEKVWSEEDPERRKA
ncbi:DUF485 domain-containing protein [Bacillus sp. S/N-304-OC-R1]|uniref:DUF485 domain-containing protein n=1 Tax=Bacillus sp. S/N-304-OC-R1 TaxID=2758034 RepID=UPI001C8E2ADB|nr:DUF485 domain-containing protein [Bacillus sp. S/N-304-OC-R1]MBY0123029.1 DUF485 domain-containing protein [Bacillus sp. S/N-304-OC-R1]